MNFWIFAVALFVLPAAIISWPLITGVAAERLAGLFIILMVPLAGILLYQTVGTPEALNQPVSASRQTAQEAPAHATQQGQMDDLVASLQQRMEENPDDPEGWLILGRSLKAMQRYTEAETALANANRLIPGNPMVMIELAETSLFASGKPQVSPEIRQLIESALAIDPTQQKGLWLMGMAYAQDGDDAQAIDYWHQLLALIEPGSGSADSVIQQIEMAQTRMGPDAAPMAVAGSSIEPAVAAQATVAETAKPEPTQPKPSVEGFNIPVNISVPDDLAGSIAGNAALFVFIHPAGARGMPLAVKRLPPRGFPLSLNFTDADLLQPGNSLENFEQLDVSARVSMSGIANAGSGDYQAARVTLDTKEVSPVTLHLDQRVP